MMLTMIDFFRGQHSKCEYYPQTPRGRCASEQNSYKRERSKGEALLGYVFGINISPLSQSRTTDVYSYSYIGAALALR
jgi:hypothetical protein